MLNNYSKMPRISQITHRFRKNITIISLGYPAERCRDFLLACLLTLNRLPSFNDFAYAIRRSAQTQPVKGTGVPASCLCVRSGLYPCSSLRATPTRPLLLVSHSGTLIEVCQCQCRLLPASDRSRPAPPYACLATATFHLQLSAALRQTAQPTVVFLLQIQYQNL